MVTRGEKKRKSLRELVNTGFLKFKRILLEMLE